MGAGGVQRVFTMEASPPAAGGGAWARGGAADASEVAVDGDDALGGAAPPLLLSTHTAHLVAGLVADAACAMHAAARDQPPAVAAAWDRTARRLWAGDGLPSTLFPALSHRAPPALLLGSVPLLLIQVCDALYPPDAVALLTRLIDKLTALAAAGIGACRLLPRVRVAPTRMLIRVYWPHPRTRARALACRRPAG